METQFVLGCLSHRLFPESPLPEAPAGVRWEQVYELLGRHHLTGLFYRLGLEHPGLWPAALQLRLRGDYHAAYLWGDRGARAVRAALEALRRDGIPAVVLKGWAAIPTLYGGDSGQRLCVDVDLLLRPADAARAEQLMLALGHTAPLEPWPGFSRRYGNGRVYQVDSEPAALAQPFSIALHWGLLDTPFYFRRIPLPDLFARTVPLTVVGVEALALAAEDDVVYACAHLALHHTYDDALVRYYELAARLLRAGPGLDWNAVIRRAEAWRLVLPLRRVLAHLGALWPGLVPAPALARIAALKPACSERLVHHCVVAHKDNPTLRAALAWLTMPGLLRRWRYLFEHAFPGPAYLRQRYGSAAGGLWPLLYLRRVALALRHLSLR